MSDEIDPHPAPSKIWKLFCLLGRLLRWTIYLLGTVWAFGAIYFNGPAGSTIGNIVIAIAWAGLTLTYFFFLRGPVKRFFIWAACMAVVLVPWLSLKASNDRDWHPDFAQTGHATIDGDTVTLHNFRNFDYTADGTITERWEDRVVHLSKLQGLDYFQDNFFGQVLSHPILSFDFGEDGRVALSIETRRENGETFGILPGLYKSYELQNIFGDEADLIRVRTNIRKEPVRLYRTVFSRERVLQLFLSAVQAQNDLHQQPRFYDVVTSNCTTGLRALTPAEKRHRWDWRILFNGRLDELLHERGVFQTADLSFESLRNKSLITGTAQQSHDAPDFSAAIRRGLPEVAPAAE